MARKLKLGIIGCGDVGNTVEESSRKAKNIEITAVLDTDPKAAENLARKKNIPYTTVLKELLARVDVDAVWITTPLFLYPEIAIAAAKAKKHIITEKPLGMNLKDADLIIKTCLQERVKLSPAFLLRYQTKLEGVKKLLENNAIGKIINVSIQMMMKKPDYYWSFGFWRAGWTSAITNNWRGDLKKSGGGVLLANMGFILDRMFYLTGLEVERVYSEYGTLATPNIEVEDMLTATFRFKNGATGCMQASSAAFGYGEMGDRIYGSEGQVLVSQMEKNKIFVTKELEGFTPNKWNDLYTPNHERVWIDSRTTYMDDFAEAVLSGKEPPVTPEDGRKVLQVIEAVYESGRSKKPVILK